MDQGGGDFGSTTPNIRINPSQTGASRRVGQTTPVQPLPPQPGPPKAGIPLKIWLIAGAALFLLLIVAAGLVWYLTREPGFTMIVRGAPPGSDVFVDNRPRGVTSADGTIRVTGLKSGKRLVRISHEGYDDFNTSVIGKDGEEKSIIAQPTQAAAKKSDPNEIDYNGPMVLIPAGEFTMGADNQNPNEKPVHKVNLPDYYIDKFEVTNEQYKKFCDATKRKYPTDPWWGKNYFAQPKLPVVGVDFADASAYAAWANKRLPTEQEWEKAASWGPGQATKRMWPWGDKPETGRANLGSQHATAVGANVSGASAYGVQDMAGNVMEWVDALYQPYPGNTATDPNFGTANRVVRGGHFRSTDNDARTTRRIYSPPKFSVAEQKERAWLIGFRCVVPANDAKLQEHLRSQK